MQHCKDMFCEELFEFYLDVQETRVLYLESVDKQVSRGGRVGRSGGGMAWSEMRWR